MYKAAHPDATNVPDLKELLSFDIPPYLRTYKRCSGNESGIAQIRIIPKLDGQYFNIEFIYYSQPEEHEFNDKEYLSIDLGLDNFATYVETATGVAEIINGRKIKSINQLYNKKLAKLRSIRTLQENSERYEELFDGDGKTTLSLCRNVWKRSRVESEMSEELQAYLEMLVDKRLKSGLSPEQARRAALIEIGGMELVKEQVREVKAGFVLESVWKDVRGGVRSIIKAPGASIVTVLSLAIGVGLNTAIFIAIDAVVFRPLPYKEPDRLVDISETLKGYKNGREPAGVAAANFLDWQRCSHSFEGMAIYDRVNYHRAIGTPAGATVSRNGYAVSANFFRVLGVEAALGKYAKAKKYKVTRVPFTGVTHPLKEEKLGLLPGARARAKMYWEIIKLFFQATA
jgi:hypothetical protein